MNNIRIEQTLIANPVENRIRVIIYWMIISWGILAIIFGLFDLQISINLVDPQSRWARWIADYGEVPGAFLIISSLLILNRLRIPLSPNRERIISIVGSAIVSILIIRYSIPLANKYDLFRDYAILWLTLLYLLIYLLQDRLKHIDETHFQGFKDISLIIVSLAILSPLISVQPLKLFWGRLRFRDLAPDHSNFTPWYLPQGITGHASFPSGHTAMGWMILPVFLLVQNKSRKIKLLVGSGIISWGVLVALGRIVIGAHYATDVLFATGIALVSFLLLYKRFKVSHRLH